MLATRVILNVMLFCVAVPSGHGNWDQRPLRRILFGNVIKVKCLYNEREWSTCLDGKQSRVQRHVAASHWKCEDRIVETRSCGPYSVCGMSTFNPAPAPVHSTTHPQHTVEQTGVIECEYPWMAWLEIQRYVCGGSLISDRHVLTAAHCLIDIKGRQVTVNLGEYNIYASSNNDVAIHAKGCYVHPGYNSSTAENDIAIIELRRPVDFNTCIRPICIPNPDQKWPTGERCVAAGWGTTTGRPVSAILQEATLSLYSADDCLSTFSGMNSNNLVHPTTVCAGNSSKDSCHGDSGGPLVCASEGAWFLTGVVSTGEGCVRDTYAGVYTEVASFANWINGIIRA